ncbi:MAG TPA: hypothetical protein DCP51_01060, partial [Clostridiales bacterium]|nr:hypothetical protein [Clostridiales bacterium]
MIKIFIESNSNYEFTNRITYGSYKEKESNKQMNPTKKQPLFIITGASCVGKSTMSELLFQNET